MPPSVASSSRPVATTSATIAARKTTGKRKSSGGGASTSNSNGQGSSSSARRAPSRPRTAGQTITLSDSDSEGEDAQQRRDLQEAEEDEDAIVEVIGAMVRRKKQRTDATRTSARTGAPATTSTNASARNARRVASIIDSDTDRSEEDQRENDDEDEDDVPTVRRTTRTRRQSSPVLPPPLTASTGPSTRISSRTRGATSASTATTSASAAPTRSSRSAAVDLTRTPQANRSTRQAGVRTAIEDTEGEDDEEEQDELGSDVDMEPPKRRTVKATTTASTVPSKKSVVSSEKENTNDKNNKKKKEGFAGTALLGRSLTADSSFISNGSDIELLSPSKPSTSLLSNSTLYAKSAPPAPVEKIISKEILKPYDLEDELGCSICYEIMVSPMGLSCYHVFCQACIEPWLADHNKECPTCRVVSSIDPVRCARTDAIITKHMEVVYSHLEETGGKKEADAARKERTKTVKAAEARRVKATQDRQRAQARAAADAARVAAQQAAAQRVGQGGGAGGLLGGFFNARFGGVGAGVGGFGGGGGAVVGAGAQRMVPLGMTRVQALNYLLASNLGPQLRAEAAQMQMGINEWIDMRVPGVPAQ